jgi:ABC-type multidrug transport system fused ATPase/permease subunit
VVFFMSAVDEEDKLDRKKAVHVLRRSFAMLRPYRRLMLAATVLVILWTFTVLAGPFLVRYAIDNGISVHDGRALDRAVVVYIAIAIAAYFIYRAQIVLIGGCGCSTISSVSRCRSTTARRRV